MKTDRYTLFDWTRNGEILGDLKVVPGDQKLIRYKSNWLRIVTWVYGNRMAKIMLIYRPNGRRRRGRPLKETSRWGRNTSVKAWLVTYDNVEDDAIFHSLLSIVCRFDYLFRVCSYWHILAKRVTHSDIIINLSKFFLFTYLCTSELSLKKH